MLSGRFSKTAGSAKAVETGRSDGNYPDFIIESLEIGTRFF
jgi:hypothetical protein